MPVPLVLAADALVALWFAIAFIVFTESSQLEKSAYNMKLPILLLCVWFANTRGKSASKLSSGVDASVGILRVISCRKVYNGPKRKPSQFGVVATYNVVYRPHTVSTLVKID